MQTANDGSIGSRARATISAPGGSTTARNFWTAGTNARLESFVHAFHTRSVVLLCALALTACTTMNVVSLRSADPAQDSPALAKSVRVDDQVRITTIDGTLHAMRLTSVSETELNGIPEGSTVATSFRTDQISRIERRELAPGRTTLLVLGVVATVAMVVVAVEAAAFAALLSN